MSQVGKINIKIVQGATFQKPFTWLAGGLPVDLTGWKARMQIRSCHESKTIIAELSTENGMIILRPLEGGFDIYMPAAATSSIFFEDAVFDIELEAPDGFVKRIVEGRASVLPEVTRDE